jgi:glycosyltransferase involved in cell wall biosynthesis
MTREGQVNGDRVILFPYAGDTMGGSVRSSYLLIEALLARGENVVTAFHGSGFAREEAQRRGFPRIDLPPLGDVAEKDRKDSVRIGNYLALPQAVRVLRQTGATIVHVNDKRMLRTWTVPSLLCGRVLLNHWRSVYTRSLSVDLGLRVARRTVTVSRYSFDLLPSWAQAKAEVVYNPFQIATDLIDIPATRARIRAEKGIPADAALIGYFGTLQKRKRPHVMFDLLDAIPRAGDGRPVMGLVCGGWVEPRDSVYEEGLKAGRHAGRLIATGHIDNPLDYMAACDVVVLPAIDEPLSRVGVEAQSLGLPPIVSSDGGLKEVVKHGLSGFVVDPYDAQGWVDHARRMIDDPDLRNRMAQASRAAAGELTVARHVDRIAAIYDELVPRRVSA